MNTTKLFSSLPIVLALASCTHEIDVEKEKAAIKAVIENETRSYMAGDLKQREKSFLQDESLVVLVTRKDWYGYVAGWDQLKRISEAIGTNTGHSADHRFENHNYRIKVFDGSAWAIYDEKLFDAEGELAKEVINVRFLEKLNGEWKISYLSHVEATSYEE